VLVYGQHFRQVSAQQAALHSSPGRLCWLMRAPGSNDGALALSAHGTQRDPDDLNVNSLFVARLHQWLQRALN